MDSLEAILCGKRVIYGEVLCISSDEEEGDEGVIANQGECL